MTVQSCMFHMHTQWINDLKTKLFVLLSCACKKESVLPRHSCPIQRIHIECMSHKFDTYQIPWLQLATHIEHWRVRFFQKFNQPIIMTLKLKFYFFRD